ncbi:MAG: hypothetical protein Fur0022_22420 [Anaerolineales bacterium]
MPFSTTLGLLRSLLIYHAIPGRIHRLTRFYAQFLKPGDLCFDIGAHAGNHTRALRRLQARVIAVEPQPAFAALLRRLYRSDSEVTLLAQALGAEPGPRTLFISHRTPTVTTLSATWADQVRTDPGFSRVHWDDALQVEVTTLDTLIQTYGLPAFCKIDVEGYELEVLRGLSHPLPLLSFEYLPATREIALACLDRLAELGNYTYNWSIGEQMQLTPHWVPPTQAAHYLQTLPPTAREGNLYAKIERFGDSATQRLTQPPNYLTT